MPTQIVISKAGGPEVFVDRNAERAPLAPDGVRVRVAAAGVNFADVSGRMGTYPDAPPIPFCPGYEVGGEVIEVGRDVEGLVPGQPVAALTRFGGYADEVAVEARQAFPLPEGLDPVRAAAVPVTYLTAQVCLFDAGGLRDGHTVLIYGGAGGVGTAAVQLCAGVDVTVIATAGSPGKCEWLSGHGVDHAIDYNSNDVLAEVRRITGGRGVDIVLDPVGGRGIARSIEACAPLGRVVLFGASSIHPGKTRSLFAIARELPSMRFFNLLQLFERNVGVHGVNMLHLANDEPDRVRDLMAGLLARVRSGELDPVIAERVPLSAEGACRAHHTLQDRRNIGKVLLVK